MKSDKKRNDSEGNSNQQSQEQNSSQKINENSHQSNQLLFTDTVDILKN